MKSIGMPKEALTEINALFFSFLWSGKTKSKKSIDKVKRAVMFNTYESGGLKMIDIISFQDSIFLSWAEALLSTRYWKSLATPFFKEVGGLSAFRSKPFKNSEIQGFSRISSPFWSDVLKCWLKYSDNNLSPLSYLDPLFNNSSVTLKGKVLLSFTSISKGVISISDMLNSNTVISYDRCHQVYNGHPNSLIDYHAICSALKNINYLADYSPDPAYYFKGVQTGDIGRKKFYLLIKPADTPISCAFWKTKFDIDINGKDWNLIHQLKETKLVVLCWKIMHNIYPTSISLFKMGLNGTIKCLHCAEGLNDHIEHFFYNCSKIKMVWREIKYDILIHMDLDVKLSEQAVLLGGHYIPDLPRSKLLQVNKAVAVGKHSISKYKFEPVRNIIDIYHSESGIRNLWGSSDNID